MSVNLRGWKCTQVRGQAALLGLALGGAWLSGCADEAKSGGGGQALPEAGVVDRQDMGAGGGGGGGACTGDFSCPVGNVCVSGACQPGQCNVERTCPAGQICENFTCSGSDVEQCVDDSTCAPRYHCLESTCQRVDCVIDDHCNPGQTCTENNRCVAQVAECVDADGDGYGPGCDAGEDCDDGNAAVNPGQTENGGALCGDGVDNDCQNGDPACGENDADGDGVSDARGDCNDNDADVNPNAPEVPYDGVDNDCNERTSDRDVDADGYEATEVGGDDCNDRAPQIHPGAVDRAGNGTDEDCDGADRMPTGDDADGDGVSEAAGDCNDENETVFPGAPEIPYNGIDDDCSAETRDNDLDSDGFLHPQDCDDRNPAVNGNATEVLYNGIDDDCNADTNDGDSDGDGFVGGPNGPDCNDGAADVNPNAMEATYNGVDDDCNPATRDDDLDGDGFARAEDCNDEDGAINPGVTENFNTLCDDGVDHDCRGGDVACDANADDADGDGVADADDCAPMDATIPGPSEIVNNGLDDDCDPATPDGCDDDVFEGPGGNDVDGSATGVDDHNGQGQQYGGLVACPGNEDWYRIDIGVGDGLEADVYFSHDGGDIDVALYKLDAAGALVYVDGSVGVDDDETVYERRAATDTTYFVKVYGFDDRRNTYALTVNVFENCTDDLDGPTGEHNDSQTEAKGLPRAGEDRRICDYDDDWYTFDVDAQASVRLDALFTHADGDLDIALYRDDSNTPIATSAGVGNGEVIEETLERGTYFVRVYGFRSAQNTYRLFRSSGQTAQREERMPGADVNIPDSANGAPGEALVDLLFDVPAGAVIRNLRIRDLDINHSWLIDLTVVAQWDGEDIVTLWNRDGAPDGSDGGLDDDWFLGTGGDINFDDRDYVQFAGLPADGIFTLVVRDNAARDTGAIADLHVEIEYFLP
ncbi:pre-peptidase C-terminal domain-containing protein [Myxococcota bacterium]|nr:pre-peptidase C-terminal domain-containing protein [Myxococcota bacterium]